MYFFTIFSLNAQKVFIVYFLIMTSSMSIKRPWSVLHVYVCILYMYTYGMHTHFARKSDINRQKKYTKNNKCKKFTQENIRKANNILSLFHCIFIFDTRVHKHTQMHNYIHTTTCSMYVAFFLLYLLYLHAILIT